MESRFSGDRDTPTAPEIDPTPTPPPASEVVPHGARAHRIGEPAPVADHLLVDEDVDVRPQAAPLVIDIEADARGRTLQGLHHLADRGRFDRDLRPLELGEEAVQELRILAQDYIDAVSGVGLTGVQLGAGKVLVQLNEAVDGAQLPVFMVLGHENLPGDFDQQLPDFERFIKQIVTMPDEAKLEKIAERMLACGGEEPMKVKLSIDERGTVSWILFEKERKETPMDCVPSALKQLHLHGTGKPRKVQFSFQHSYPSRTRPPAVVTPPPALPDPGAKPPTP